MCSQTLSRLRSNDLTPEKAKKRLLLPPHDHFHSIFKQTEKMWIRDFLHVVIAESRAFPAEANMAILFLYDFGRHAIQTYFEEQQPAGPDPASRAIALQGIVATFILLRQIYHAWRKPVHNQIDNPPARGPSAKTDFTFLHGNHSCGWGLSHTQR